SNHGSNLPRTKKARLLSSFFVGVAGFEPTTSTSQMWRDTGLRYTPIRYHLFVWHKYTAYFITVKTLFSFISLAPHGLQNNIYSATLRPVSGSQKNNIHIK